MQELKAKMEQVKVIEAEILAISEYLEVRVALGPPTLPNPPLQ